MYDNHDDFWKTRERDRFLRGEYVNVPWNNEPFYANSRHYHEHFTHVSNHDPRMIAYTESADKGRRDIQTRVKPGKYLKRYFGDVLGDDEIKAWAERFNAENVTQELRFALQPDDIERVYVNGPRSCMSDAADEYEGGCHPARVYGAGDLAIAYIEPEPGSITARVVCWPKHKIYHRVYGDEPRLGGLLEKAGFTQGASHKFHGARLLKIEYDCDRYVCPYLDMASEVGVEGDHLIIGGDDLDARRTDGLTGESGYPCERCGDRCDEDESYCVNDATWCRYCYENYAFACEHCSESYHNDYSRTVHDRYGHEVVICDGCFDCGDYRMCDECNEDHHNGNLSEATNADGDSVYVCGSCREENYSTCDECDECHHDECMEHINDRHLCDGCADDARAGEESDEQESDATGGPCGVPCGPIDDPRQLPIPLEDAA